MEQVEELADYQRQHEEIEAACEKMEPHRAEFEALLADEPSFLERCQTLFAEERFAPFRFHAADLRRAFEKVGYPGFAADPKRRETLLKAILFLADEERRGRLSRELLKMLPDYVAANRYLDAWVIQYCAFLMTEQPDQSNPFLFEMVYGALLEWDDQRDQQADPLLSAMGISREQLQTMPPDEREQFIANLLADPSNRQRLEEFAATHPEMLAILESEARSADDMMIALLERDDTAHLLPAEAEIIPWLEVFQQRVLADERLAGVLRGESPAADVSTALGDLLGAVSEEMAAAMYTTERRAQLEKQLREFADQRRAADDFAGVAQAQAALLVLVRDPEPRDNFLLTSLCWTALRKAMRTLAPSSPPA